MIRARLFVLAAAGLALSLAGCGNTVQNRPGIVSTFPAADQALVGWLAEIKVRYDQPVHVLNEDAVRLTADTPDGTLEIQVRAFDDPTDDHAILVHPVGDGFFAPNAEHHLVVQEGAAANLDGHYKLDEYSTFFTTGAAPNLFLASDDGNVYEVDPATGASIFATAPPVGFEAKRLLGADGQVYAWLDPVVLGSSVLARFVPGTATITTTVTLTGESGTRRGSHLILSQDGRILYATARDSASNRLYLHRIVAATGTEVGAALVLSQPLAGAEPDFQPGLDTDRDRLYVPFSDGAGGGFLAVVDLETFLEIDAGPLLGVDALPVPDGAGDCAYESTRDFIEMILHDEAQAGFVVISPQDFDIFPALEPTITGKPTALFATPDGQQVIQGLGGYAGLEGLCDSDAQNIGNGFAQDINDDVLGVLQGSTDAPVLLRDPASTNLFVFANDGATTFLAIYDWFDGGLVQLDLDLLTVGVQVVSLGASAPGVVISATTLLGQVPP